MTFMFDNLFELEFYDTVKVMWSQKVNLFRLFLGQA